MVNLDELKGQVKRAYIAALPFIGYEGINTQGEHFKVIDCKLRRTKNGKRSVMLYQVYYEYTKYSDDWHERGNILKGTIKDPYYPSIYGVACCGKMWVKINDEQHPLYDTWRSMIRRCYDPNFKYYNIYGGAGILYVKNGFALSIL